MANQDKKPGDIVPSNTVLEVKCDEGYGLSSNNAFVTCESAHVMPQCECEYIFSSHFTSIDANFHYSVVSEAEFPKGHHLQVQQREK